MSYPLGKFEKSIKNSMNHRTYLNNKKLPEFEESPYLLKIMGSSRIKKSAKNKWFKAEDNIVIHDHNTGEEIKVSGISTTKFRSKDSRPFLKVYSFKTLTTLSLTELKVLDYISTILEKNNVHFHFSYPDCMKYCGYTSTPVVVTAVTGLLEKDIFCKSPTYNKFWINPEVIFNGDLLPATRKHAKVIRDNLDNIRFKDGII